MMNITFNTQSMQERCLKVQRCVPSKHVLAHIEGILINAENTAGDVELNGFDLELGVKCFVEGAQINEPGSVVINAKKLCDIFKFMPGDRFTLETDEKNVCKIYSGETSYNLMGLNAAEYPELPEVTDANPLVIPKKTLRSMIRQTIFAVSLEDSKQIYRGIKFEIEPGEIRLIALDGFRLAIRREFLEYNGESTSFVAPSKTLTELLKLLNDEEGFVKIYKSKKNIMFDIDGYILLSKLYEGDFIDYKKAIPTVHTTFVRVNTAELIETIERVSIIINEKSKTPVILQFDSQNSELNISSVSATESSKDRMDCSVDGNNLKIAFNNQFLIDALRSCDAEEAVLAFAGYMTPALLLPTDGDRFMYLILPVVIKQ